MNATPPPADAVESVPEALVGPRAPRRERQNRECAGCGKSEAKFLFRKSGYPVVECNSCGLRYLDYQPTAAELDAFYSTGYFTGEVKTHGYAHYEKDKDVLKRNFSEKVREIEDALGRKGRILEVGCATGFFLEAASEAGWDVAGVEISKYAGEVARKTFGDKVYVGPFETYEWDGGKFDVIAMWDVMEHLPTPVESLSVAAGMLKDDGLFVACTVDDSSIPAKIQGKASRIYIPPQHLYYYTRKSARLVLARAGLTVTKVKSDSKRLSLDYVFFIFACVNSNPLTRGLYKLFSSTPFGRIHLKVPLLDNQVIFARKKAA